ncbi:hypothetical protein MPSEU_000240600 [Mayamaea pseudoterrestris]|nr:hypothetical protein MPSEU_000240600 [Mayamaea pseudoterrestris]
MRRRRDETVKPNGEDDAVINESSESEEEGSNLLDQDDQDRVVAEIEQKIIKQQVQIRRVFTALCRTTAIVSFLLVVIDDLTESTAYPPSQRMLRYLQGIVSLLLQFKTIRLAIRDGKGENDGLQSTASNASHAEKIEDDEKQTNEAGSSHVARSKRSLNFTCITLLVVNALLSAAVIIRYEPLQDSSSSAEGTLLDHQGHWLLPIGLVLANLATLGAAFLLHWDQRDSQRQLCDLKGVKYHYKSL